MKFEIHIFTELERFRYLAFITSDLPPWLTKSHLENKLIEREI